MHVLASLFDPNDNGFDIADLVEILGLVVLIVGSTAALVKWATYNIRQIVREEIGVATYPIQKEANGGLSLPDVARTSDWNKQALKAIAEAHGIALPDDPH
jgi:hypothetical protein